MTHTQNNPTPTPQNTIIPQNTFNLTPPPPVPPLMNHNSAVNAPAASAGVPELYSLKWNDYVHNLQSVFKYLRDSDEFSDCTIACVPDEDTDDGVVTFKAHRIILAACSAFFQRVLGGGGGGGGGITGGGVEQRGAGSKAQRLIQPGINSHPIVYLKDVRSGVFKNILNFVYYGEVQVANTELPEFLSVASSLKIKGLVRTPDQNVPPQQPTAQNFITQTQTQQAAIPRVLTPIPPITPLEQRNVNERVNTPPPTQQPKERVSPVQEYTTAWNTPPSSHNMSGQQPQGHQQAQQPRESDEDEENKFYEPDNLSKFFKHDDDSFMLKSPYGSRIRATDPRPCPKCGKIYRSAHTLRTHLEDKHTICPGYRCVLCGTVAKSRNSLHSHMSRQHRGISTKDLPVIPMPAPFDPDLANRLLAKIGADRGENRGGVGERTGDRKLEISYERMEDMECDSEGDDEVSVENEGSITKHSESARSIVSSTRRRSADPDNIDRPEDHGIDHEDRARASSSSSPHVIASSSGSAILDTYLQLIAENSSAVFAAAAAAAAAAAQASGKEPNTTGQIDPPLPPPPDLDSPVKKPRPEGSNERELDNIENV